MASREKHDRMANAIRFLSMDAVEKANSGHPGLPMGAADIATVLFTRFLKFDPKNPNWPDRDRFVLSAGHGSMLLYSLLYLLGYEDIDDRRDQEFPPARLEDRRPPGIRPRRRHRDHHRPARPGPRQCGRHGASPNAAGRRIRRRSRRPPHLCARRRRLPDGRHQPGSDLACRTPEAQQADRAVGRQRHLHRRQGVACPIPPTRSPASRPPAGTPSRRRPRPRCDCRGHRAARKVPTSRP